MGYENHHFANIDRNNIKCISICRISIEFESKELENWIQTGDANVFLCPCLVIAMDLINQINIIITYIRAIEAMIRDN